MENNSFIGITESVNDESQRRIKLIREDVSGTGVRVKFCDLDTLQNEGSSSICAVWDFRCNEDMYDAETLWQFMKSNCKKYIFQKEKSDSGYIHWQGRFSLIKKRNKSSLMKLMNVVPNYLMPTAKVNHQDLFFYCMKEDTRIGETYMDEYHRKLLGLEEVFMPLQYQDIKPYKWQQLVLDSADQFDKRCIDLIFDPTGGKGKSTIAAIAEIKYKAIDMPIMNDYRDLVSLACNICMDTQNRSPKLMFFDMPRSMNKSSLDGFYSAIEQIKKGKLYDVRYHYKAYWINSPRVWVFSNELPDVNLLSRDRWRIWQINDKNELVPYKDNSDSYIKKKKDPKPKA